jgi:hypothetical protein
MRKPEASESILLVIAILLISTIALGLVALDAGTMLLSSIGVAILVLALRLLRHDDPPEDH